MMPTAATAIGRLVNITVIVSRETNQRGRNRREHLRPHPTTLHPRVRSPRARFPRGVTLGLVEGRTRSPRVAEKTTVAVESSPLITFLDGVSSL